MDARILRTFDGVLAGRDGRMFVARIGAHRGPDGRWEGWVEFVPRDGGSVLRSARETTQSDLRNMERWTWALGRVYLEGSLERTLKRGEGWSGRDPTPTPTPTSGPPAPGARGADRPAPDDVALNPMLHYRRGEASLRRRVEDLPPAELRAIALAYRFDGEGIDVATLDRSALVEIILAGVRERSGG